MSVRFWKSTPRLYGRSDKQPFRYSRSSRPNQGSRDSRRASWGQAASTRRTETKRCHSQPDTAPQARPTRLLEPVRDAVQDGSPSHWTHIPCLPPKGAKALTGTPEKLQHYRVKLFGTWYLLRFEPSISETRVHPHILDNVSEGQLEPAMSHRKRRNTETIVYVD